MSSDFIRLSRHVRRLHQPVESLQLGGPFLQIVHYLPGTVTCSQLPYHSQFHLLVSLMNASGRLLTELWLPKDLYIHIQPILTIKGHVTLSNLRYCFSHQFGLADRLSLYVSALCSHCQVPIYTIAIIVMHRLLNAKIRCL